jgi:hypothetical protein
MENVTSAAFLRRKRSEEDKKVLARADEKIRVLEPLHLAWTPLV